MATTITLYFGPTITLFTAPGDEHGDVMPRAFALVSPDVWGRSDWKAPVSAVLTDADLKAANVTLDNAATNGVQYCVVAS